MGYKRSVGDLPASANVVIIGAGFAGVATAWALQRLGISDVLVLEREVQPGRFASGRSAGLGRQLAEDEDTTRLTVRGAALMRQLPAWAPTGGMLSFDDEVTANAYLDRARRHDVAVEPGLKDLVMARWPQLPDLRITHALLVPSDGTIDVGGLLSLLSQGVRIEVATPVVRVEAANRGASVVTSRVSRSRRSSATCSSSTRPSASGRRGCGTSAPASSTCAAMGRACCLRRAIAPRVPPVIKSRISSGKHTCGACSTKPTPS